jgi:hypothetical protein
MDSQTICGRVLCLHAAAKRLRIPERTLRYRASRGWIQGAYKQGKLWKFPLVAIEKAQRAGGNGMSGEAVLRWSG